MRPRVHVVNGRGEVKAARGRARISVGFSHVKAHSVRASVCEGLLPSYGIAYQRSERADSALGGLCRMRGDAAPGDKITKKIKDF